ncbi:ABC transporter permease [Arthrobacter gyeryongensis]|uniref:ABC transporter permease n=2 Tax=Arthrobacter TaxID=1663 RepID=A0ABP9RZR4_9MICC
MNQMKTSRQGGVAHLLGPYGLVVILVVLFAVFALILPQTFLSGRNFNAILSNQAIPALLALGAMIPIATGKFDLSIGYGLGLSHVIVLKLIVDGHVPWGIAALAAIGAMAVVGIINGLLVEFGQIDSFVATLGTGTVLYSITGAITNGARVVPGDAGLPASFKDLYDSKIAGVPIVAVYLLIVAVILWVLFERLPLGRYFYVLGSNPRAAALMGIPTKRYSIYAFSFSAVVTGVAGVLLASQQQIGNPSVGMDYLLPAFVGALLGATAIKPGRANVIGTLVAVITLAIGLAGISQLGAQFWVTPLFNGVTLLIAVGLAGYSARRKLRAGAVAAPPPTIPTAGEPAADDAGPSSPAGPETPAAPPATPATTAR